ncbi:hypothetical protein EEB19_20170 [Gordonia sp. OPL2]|nr:hypothetical protein EEB19_20170 [Gordonia sp. OPL2]
MQSSIDYVGRFIKDPSTTRPYTQDWSKYLADIDDQISSVSFTVEAGLTKGAVSNTATNATVVLSGGTAGVSYDVTCQITTVGGVIDERTAQFLVQSR